MPDPLTFGAWLIWQLPGLVGAVTVAAVAGWIWWMLDPR